MVENTPGKRREKGDEESELELDEGTDLEIARFGFKPKRIWARLQPQASAFCLISAPRRDLLPFRWTPLCSTRIERLQSQRTAEVVGTMETEAQLSLSLRASRRTERSDWGTRRKGDETDVSANGSDLHDPLRMVWRKGFIRFFSGCGIPVVDDPDTIVIPKRTPDTVPKSLTYVLEDEQENADEKSQPLFGGHQNWKQRENSFKLNTTMKVHCGFIKNGGGEVDAVDVKYAKKCRSIYEEADAIKRRKRYARPLIDLHMKIYRYEGMELWSPKKRTISDVPEGAVIIREHTAVTNLFSCLWFNEVNLFTPRDQLSFGYVVHRLGEEFKFFMFPNCEYNSLFMLHRHTREHSSVVEWVKSLDEFKGNMTGLRETRGGLGLWKPYPGDLSSVQLPSVKRTSPAG
ncbi:hypothetical protein MUK42_26145 [Musa troglodytarum]|uniref:TOD1/MUCI70 glycosyltransferase-like domain-containing protein n=1 Tax=Musa troglodytarum TaxID=320322 RepID=A0A9E7HXE0_9LILI|nr:hypothetical protein MUK42_26145 [Musa troglodytarum]